MFRSYKIYTFSVEGDRFVNFREKTEIKEGFFEKLLE